MIYTVSSSQCGLPTPTSRRYSARTLFRLSGLPSAQEAIDYEIEINNYLLKTKKVVKIVL